MALKCICVEFKGLQNGVDFTLIDPWVDELLSINKVSNLYKLTAFCWVLPRDVPNYYVV